MIRDITKFSAITAVALIALFANSVAIAQADFDGQVTLSYLNWDEEGNRSAARELSDTYDGFNLQKLSGFGNINTHTRYSLQMDDLNLDGRRINFNVTDINLFKIKGDYRQSRLLFGPNEDRQNERKSYSGYFGIKPTKAVSGFLEYRSHTNEGDRVIYDNVDEGLFGDKYDRRSTVIRGGARYRYESHQLEISYGNRDYDDRINDLLDSKTDFLNVSVFGKLNSKVKVIAQFANTQKELKVSEDKLKENSFRITALTRPHPRLTLAPVFNLRKVTGESTDTMFTDPDFTALRYGLDLTYSLPHNTSVSGALGYESRTAADFKSNLLYYSIAARSRFTNKIAARLSYSGDTRKDPDEVLVTGVEDKTKAKAEIEFSPCEYTNIEAGYKLNQRENSDIDTKAEINTLYATFNGRRNDRGGLAIQLNRSDVEYTWGSETLKYKYSSVNGNAECHPKDKLTLSAGGTFYVFDDDVQQDKLDVTLGIAYHLPKADVKLSYRRYELDGYGFSPSYYEANLIKGEITVDLNK